MIVNTKKNFCGKLLCMVLVAALLVSGLTACTAKPAESSAASSEAKLEMKSEASSQSSQEAPQEAAALQGDELATDIILNFGAEWKDDEGGAKRLWEHKGSSLFTRENINELSANTYYAWYLGQVWNEDLPQEQKLLKYKSPLDDDTGWFFPQELYEPCVQRYFDVTTEYLRSSDAYLPEHKGYSLMMGGGIGDTAEILHYKTVRNGDRLDLHLTLRYGNYNYEGRPNQYKILSVQMQPDGTYHYITYATDTAPAPEQIEAAKRDNTALSTDMDATYVNEKLGITLRLPENWKNNYLAVVKQSGYQGEEAEGWSIKLSYKDSNSGAVLGMIFVVPVELWERVRQTSTSFDVVLGKNSRYVFTADLWKNPFSEGADHDLFAAMSFPVRDMVAMATITEPKE